MKRTSVILTVLAVLLLPLLASASESNPWERKLPFENATIKYVLSGSEKGTETLYIRDYGKEMATYHKTTNTMGTKVDRVTIMTLDSIYHFDLLSRTGTKSTNPHKYMVEEYNKLSKADQEQVRKNAKDMGLSMTKGLNGKIEKNAEKILGYDCDRATVMGTTVYSIHNTGIPLKSDTSIMGVSMKKEPTDIKTGSIDAKVFKFPEGIVPKNDPQGDEMAKTVAKQTIAMLKNPEGVKTMVPPNAMINQGGSAHGKDNAQQMSNEQLEHAMEMLRKMQNKKGLPEGK